MTNNGLIAGLDIGTTKVCAVIGERGEQGVLEITGVGLSPSTGLRQGVVVNIEATLNAVKEAIGAAEMMSGHEVSECWIGIGGKHIEGINSRGVVAISKKNTEDREIGPEDVAKVIEAAKAVVIPMDRSILEVLPHSYVVDNQKGIRDPLDMMGVRLEADVHIVTCQYTCAQNLNKCVNRAGFRVKDLILQSLAAGRAVLSQEEKDLGTVLVDLGGGSTNVLVYTDGAPYSTFTVPAGGADVTNDISKVKHISFEVAEKIKIDSGCCWEPLIENDEDILVPGVGGRPPMPIPRLEIAAIIKYRMKEIFEKVKEKMDIEDLSRRLGGGIVLTGGGAKLTGVAELAGEVFDVPVRSGSPIRFPELRGLVEEYRNPAYATAIGLLLEGNDREIKVQPEGITDVRKPIKDPLFSRLKFWVKREFI
ncbi:MAG: cell division protein FtsA [Treponema sp.]|nr:cell division protein FtsA [Treponema sp.]